jgi:hypothetical protein
MNIQYYGDYCFKITAKPLGRATEDIVLWTDPCGTASGLRSPQGQADVLFLSHTNGIDAEASGLKGNRMMLNHAGEYAINGVNAFGIATFQDIENGALRGQNTIFEFQVESMRLCFLGALGHELNATQIEKISSVDVLFVPVGNKDTLAVKSLEEVIRKIEPAVIIPMHYKLDGMTQDIDDEKVFCGEMGNCPVERVSKLSLKKKDFEGKNMEVILMHTS